MDDGIGKTIKLFLIWSFLNFAVGIIVVFLGHIFKSEEIMKWTLALGYLLISIVYLGKHYVDLSFGCIERRMLWPAVGMSVLVAVANLFVTFFVVSMLDSYLFMEESESLNQTGPNLFSGIAGILHSCIIVPIVEEIGFRGIFLAGLLKSRCRPWLAILITAIVFALFHMSFVKIISILGFGIIIGWLYWRTGSIIPGIIIHIVNNSLCIVFAFIDLSIESLAIWWVILVVCLSSLAYGVWWFWKKCKYDTEEVK